MSSFNGILSLLRMHAHPSDKQLAQAVLSVILLETTHAEAESRLCLDKLQDRCVCNSSDDNTWQMSAVDASNFFASVEMHCYKTGE